MRHGRPSPAKIRDGRLLNKEGKGHMHISTFIKDTLRYAFIVLWGYAATSKLLHWEQSRQAMLLQPLPEWLTQILFWLLPLVQLLLAGLLLHKRTVRYGLRYSTLLLATFTLYLLLAVSRFFGSVPCACAGIWPGNSYWLHIALNSIFIIPGTLYWVLAPKRPPAEDVAADAGRKEDTAT